MVDCTPPLIQVIWLMHHSMMNCAARVAMARYSPLIRRDGMPKNAPTTAAIGPPQKGHAVSGGEDRCRIAPHRHEGAMADGNLAGIAGENVEADGPDDGDAHEIRQTQQMVIAQQGHDHGAKNG